MIIMWITLKKMGVNTKNLTPFGVTKIKDFYEPV